MNDEPSRRVAFGDELDARLRSSLDLMLAGEPSESQITKSLERIRRRVPERSVPLNPRAVGHRHGWRFRWVVAATLLLLVLWSGSSSEAWAQIAQDYQNAGSSIEIDQTKAAADSVSRPPVGAALRFVLMAHVAALIAGLAGMVVAWILSIANWLAPSNWTLRRSRLSRWENRVLIASCATYAVGVALGCIWSQATWGRIWGWDPREAFALVTLGIASVWYFSSSMRSVMEEPGGASEMRTYMAASSVAFWLIVLAYVLAGIYAAKIHSFGYPSAMPNIVVGLCVIQLSACFLLRFALKRVGLN